MINLKKLTQEKLILTSLENSYSDLTGSTLDEFLDIACPFNKFPFLYRYSPKGDYRVNVFTLTVSKRSCGSWIHVSVVTMYKSRKLDYNMDYRGLQQMNPKPLEVLAYLNLN